MAQHGRRFDLDWLRVILFGILVPYHAAIGFVHYGHSVYGFRNQDVAGGWLEMALFFSHTWRLPALFMISGVGTWFLLHRGSSGYLRNRLVRLGIPLLVGMLVWNVPYGYLQHLVAGGTDGYWRFYSDWIAEFRWGHARHLWFLMNLLVYSILLAAIAPLLNRLPTVRLPVFALMLLVVALVIEVLFKPFSYYRPLDYRDFWYFPFFVGGYVAMYQREAFWILLARLRWVLLAVGIALSFSFMAIYGLVAPEQAGILANGGWISAGWSFASLPTLVHSIAYSANAVLWCAILFGFAFRHLNRGSRVLSTLNRAVYPVYIFHFPIMMAGLYLLRGVAWPWQFEWLVLTLGTFALSGLACAVLDRGRIAPILIGLKPR